MTAAPGQERDWLVRQAMDIPRQVNLEAEDDNDDDDDDDSGDTSDQKVELILTPEQREAATKVELFYTKKRKSALVIDILDTGPYLTRIVAWGFRDPEHDPKSVFSLGLDDPDRGFVQSAHPSFELYRRTKWFTKTGGHPLYEADNSEVNTFLDAESDPRYENVNPGTVTVEGFGDECWDYEEVHGTRPGIPYGVILVPCAMPAPDTGRMLRRLDEFRRNEPKAGVDPDQDERDLREFVGDEAMASVTFTGQPGSIDFGTYKPSILLYGLLSRNDVFDDFRAVSNLSSRWIGAAGNFMWQVIVTKELARRLKDNKTAIHTIFTPRVLASLIVSDLYLQNCEISLRDMPPKTAASTKELTPVQQEKVETIIKKAEKAIAESAEEETCDLYREAIAIDDNNTTYRIKLCQTLISRECYAEAVHEAAILTTIAPNDFRAWALLGLANLEFGKTIMGVEAMRRAVEVGVGEEKSVLAEVCADAEKDLQDLNKRLEDEQDPDKKDALRKTIQTQKWDAHGKLIAAHSKVHARQTEGLILFAETMKWPRLEEARQWIGKAYDILQSGQQIAKNLHDWLFGMMLPGKWFAFTIMASLVRCTPTIGYPLVPRHFNCGLVMPEATYWRIRTGLGRVLGSLPGVVSQNGWIGPCPNVEFDTPLATESEKEKARWIVIRSKPVPHNLPKPTFFDDSDDDDDPELQYDGEQNIEAYVEEMEDPQNWILLEPPKSVSQDGSIANTSKCELKSIRLKRVDPPDETDDDDNDDDDDDDGEDEEDEGELGVETETEYYAASIEFQLSNDDDDDKTGKQVTFNLTSDPVFVTCPPCYPSYGKSGHEFHTRQQKVYKHHVWTAEELRVRKPEDIHNDFDKVSPVIVIDATSNGTETLARAWCAEHGRSAVIRRLGGPCYSCAIRAAGQKGTRVGVLIWVS